MMESGSCISTATFIQIITKSPSPQFAGWGMILSVPIPIPPAAAAAWWHRSRGMPSARQAGHDDPVSP